MSRRSSAKRHAREQSLIVDRLARGAWRRTPMAPEVGMEFEASSRDGARLRVSHRTGRRGMLAFEVRTVGADDASTVSVYFGGRLRRLLKVLEGLPDKDAGPEGAHAVTAVASVAVLAFDVQSDGTTLLEPAPKRYRSLLATGRERAARAAFTEAIAQFDTVLRAAPGAWEVWYERGRALEARDRADEAKRAFARTIRLCGIAARTISDPELRAQARWFRGRAWARRNDSIRAVRDLLRALALDATLHAAVLADRDLASVRREPLFEMLLGEGWQPARD